MKTILIILFFLCATTPLSAQNNKADSLLKLIALSAEDTNRVQLIYRLCSHYININRNLDSAEFYIQQGLLLSRKLNNRECEAWGLNYLGAVLYFEGNITKSLLVLQQALALSNQINLKNNSLKISILEDFYYSYLESKPDSSIFYARQILEVAQNIKDKEQEANALFSIANGFYNLGNYPQALELMLQANDIFTEFKDSVDISSDYGFIGAIYVKQGDFRKGIHYLTQSEEMDTKTHNNELNLQRTYTQKGLAYLKLNILDSALWYEQQAYDISIKLTSYVGSGMILNYIGNIYEKFGKNKVAHEYYRQSIQYCIRGNTLKNLSQVYTSLARYFYNSGNIDSSIFYGYKAMAIAESGSFLFFASEAYNLLMEAYRSKRNIDSTFKYLNLMLAAKDSLFSREKVQQMEFLVSKEEQQKKQIAAEKLAYQNKVKIYSLFVGFAVLLLIAVILWRNNTHKQKANALLQQQKEKVESTLSELKSTQAQLIQSEKMASLGELTAGIAHEIQNPLNFVNNFSEVNTELIDELKTELATGNVQQAIEIADNLKDNEEKIVSHGKRADAIVKGMLQHSRSSSGVKEPTDINALADEYLRLAYHGLRAKDKSFNVTLKTDYDETIGNINVVPQDIGRVILNLITNAFYAVTEKQNENISGYEPTVTISTKRSLSFGEGRGEVKIKVADNGNGISKKVLDKIFQPFFTTKPTGQGTGLGLSLAYDIIKAHGGEIKTETKEKEGSEFIIQLPAN